MITVTVSVSKPYVAIAGGWSGMRPVGMRSTYRATVNGKHCETTNKSQIAQRIRLACYPERVKVVFVQDE